MTFLITIIALGIVIFAHELGHMLVAKKAGVGVLEFSVGMGPKIYGKKVGETLYCLRAFPFGGFVKLAGLDDDDDGAEPIPAELDFYEKSIISRTAIIVAGCVTNIILGFLIYILIFLLSGNPIISNIVEQVMPETPAYKVGLLAGDKILAIDGHKVINAEIDITKRIRQSANKTLVIEYERAAQTFSVNITPEQAKNAKHVMIGVLLKQAGVNRNPILAVKNGAKETVNSIKMVFTSLSMLFTGKVSLKHMAGPIGIVQIAAFSLKKGLAGFLNIMALISVSLGVINLFPFPVLDGGHILFLALEAIRKKRLGKKTETIITNMGAAVLISLMLIIIVNDVVFWKERLLFLKSLKS
jgi:regulator of sigma E protease